MLFAVKNRLLSICGIALLALVASSPAQAFTNNYSLFEAFFLSGPQNGIVRVSDDKKEEGAKNFITGMGNKAIGFLSDEGLSKQQKANEFRKLLNHHYDMNTIARFALGRNWSQATPAQRKEYQLLFKKMIVDVYSNRFDEYQGQSFEVKSVRPTGKKDHLVSSLIVPDQGAKVKVDWRVRHSNGRYKVIDVMVEGVSMALTQRSEFASIIQRGGGNLDTLIEHLKK